MEHISRIQSFSTSFVDESKNEMNIDNKNILDEFNRFLSKQEKDYQELNNQTDSDIFSNNPKKHITLIKNRDDALNLFKNYPKVFSLFNIKEKTEILESFLQSINAPKNQELHDDFVNKLSIWNEEASKNEVLDLVRQLQLLMETADNPDLIEQLIQHLRTSHALDEESDENIELDKNIQDERFNQEIDNKILIKYKFIMIENKENEKFNNTEEISKLNDEIYNELSKDVNFCNNLIKDINSMKEIYKNDKDTIESLNNFQVYLESTDIYKLQLKEKEQLAQIADKKFKELDNKILFNFKNIADRIIKTSTNIEVMEEKDKFKKEANIYIKSDLDAANQLLLDIETMKEIYKYNSELLESIQNFQGDIEPQIKKLNEARETNETYLIGIKKLKPYELKLKTQSKKIEGAFIYKTDDIDIKKIVPIGNYIASGVMGSVSMHETHSEWVVKEGSNLSKEYYISKLLGDNPSFVKMHRLYVRDKNSTKKSQKDIIVMDYVEGKTLSNLIIIGPNIDIKVVENLFLELPSTIKYLFEKNVVFGDLNAGNIILNKENKLVLIDFGYWNEEKNDDKKTEGLLAGQIQLMGNILLSSGINEEDRAKLLHPKVFFSSDFPYDEYVNLFTEFSILFKNCSHALDDIIDTNEKLIEKDPLKFLNSYIDAVIENVKTYSK